MGAARDVIGLLVLRVWSIGAVKLWAEGINRLILIKCYCFYQVAIPFKQTMFEPSVAAIDEKDIGGR